MSEKRVRYMTFGTGALCVLVGVVCGMMFERYHLIHSDAGIEGAPQDVNFAPVWKAWNILDEKFVPAAVATSTPIATSTAELNQQKVYGMISGLAASLNDPYTFFMPPQESKDFGDDMSGQFTGVGMEIEVRDQVLTVISPLKGTPASAAGVKAGDKILKIDDEETKGMSAETAVKKIRGPKGTVVKLLLYRDGWDAPKEIPVTRDVINVPIVNTTARPDGVFVISVATFTQNSPDLFRSALREFAESGDSRLILDLRGNPGGYLEAAVSMASWFLPEGKVIVTENYAGHAPDIVHRSYGYDVFSNDLKMLILVDKGSASASEILSDALRHYDVAKLIGTNTYGKGSVQELLDITPDTSLKVTVARWLGPDGQQIPRTGLVPDIEATTTVDDIKNHNDVQLEKAAQYLKNL